MGLTLAKFHGEASEPSRAVLPPVCPHCGAEAYHLEATDCVRHLATQIAGLAAKLEHAIQVTDSVARCLNEFVRYQDRWRERVEARLGAEPPAATTTKPRRAKKHET